MNLKEIEYIVKIAEERNVTRAAEKLFITPSALNQQLLHLERDIGTPLFYRSRTGWTPTEAGRIYLETASEMLRMKKETYHRLQDIVNTKKGTLSIGLPPERGSNMFTHIYPVFHKEYPDILINVAEASVKRQQALISQGEIDIGFMTLRENQKTSDEYIFICKEELVLVIPEINPITKEAKRAKGHSKYPELDISLLHKEPFALMYKGSTIYDSIDAIFRHAGFVPNVLFETSRAHTIIDMVAANLCCSIVPDSEYIPHKDGVSFFCLPLHPTWDIVASYRKGSYLSKAAKRFVFLASMYFKENGSI